MFTVKFIVKSFFRKVPQTQNWGVFIACILKSFCKTIFFEGKIWRVTFLTHLFFLNITFMLSLKVDYMRTIRA